ncbi:ExeM/NucH family extracellular endonuclease [Deinococcus sp.]|uniref:ExeM/NucH family extracellular endonuclease n=1 Tax=Deinococcus sp. TaxID=47478 RepID=UPI002869C0CF|nr:ExeM/NucH family extracellular endonuclease [Deinococcus sp.]
MRVPLIVAVSCTLLAACNNAPAPTTVSSPELIAQAKKIAVLTVETAPDVKLAELTLLPVKQKKGEVPQVFTAAPKDGLAVFPLSTVKNADYQMTVKGYDADDRAVVLYSGTSVENLKSGQVTKGPKLKRETAAVVVDASPALDATTYTASIGAATLPMTVKNGVATVKFTKVPTARDLTVTVTGTTGTGQTAQTGQANFTLSENGVTVAVGLSAQAVCPAPTGTLTTIPAIQGNGAASPLVGQSVTVRGVVTADYHSGLKGFMLQDAQGDGNAATSDGVFVYTGTAPQTLAAGDAVQFTATVKEFGTAPGTLTELDTLTDFAKCNAGQIIKPVEISAPFNDLERFEGMLVTYPGTLTLTDNYPYGRYGELGLSAVGRQFNPTNGNSAAPLTTADLLTNRIVLDDAISAQNPNPLAYLSPAENTRRTGDTVTGLTGTLTYANGAFKVEPVGTVPFVDANLQPAMPKAVGGTLTVAGANVLNYFTTFGASTDRGADSAAEFQRQRTKIFNALRGLDADIVTLMEVQNNGDAALNDLVSGLNSAYGSEVYRAIQTGVIGTDAIKVAMIYKPASVTPLGAYVIDTNSVYSRPPLAQTFQKLGGGTLTVIANHFKSKGSCPSSGDVDTGQGCWNMLRVQQANAVTAFATSLKARVNDPDVLIMGDLNAYGEEDPIKTIEAASYESLNKRIDAADRYSYQFGGLFGYLDHALSSTALSAQVTGITEWHVNADEPVVADYNTEFKATPGCSGSCTGVDLYNGATPFRASDHDPVLVGLNLAQDNPTNPTEPLTVSATGNAATTTGQPYSLSVTVTGSPDSTTVGWGDGTTDPVTSSPVMHTYTASGSFIITVTATRGAETKTATQAVTVSTVPVGGVGKLVISQVYGAGGNGGATQTNDFIEIFNAGSAALNLNGYSVQYASSANTSTFSGVTVLPDFTLQPGQYYLVLEAKGSGGTVTPSGDTTGTIAMAGAAGQVLIAQQTTAVLKDAASVVDYYAYSGLSVTSSASRAGNGCTDTDMAADFSNGDTSPRNAASPLNVCP